MAIKSIVYVSLMLICFNYGLQNILAASISTTTTTTIKTTTTTKLPSTTSKTLLSTIGIPKINNAKVPGAQDPKCLHPVEPGPCHMKLERFYYNSKKNMCEKFVFGGCYGNDNKFGFRKTCEDACLLRADSTSTIKPLTSQNKLSTTTTTPKTTTTTTKTTYSTPKPTKSSKN